MAAMDSLPSSNAETLAEWREETDTVEARFGGEYSEATLDMMRSLKKPEWMEEESSLDPVEDIEDHARHNMRLPPTTYDALQEAAAEEIARLKAGKELRLDPEDERLIQYRKQLVDGTSLEDVKWLKLRAYHRAVDKLRAKEDLTPEAKRHLMEEHDVPLDKVPMELIDMTPEQLGDRWQQAQRAGPSADAHSYSEDSDWAGDWNSSSYLQNNATRRQLQAAILPVRNFRVGFSIRKQRPPADPLEGFGEIMTNGDPERRQEWKPVHGYTAEFLQEQALERQLQSQKRQRALAFWVPLATVLGFYAVRGIRRLMMKPKGGSKGVPKGSQKSAA